MAVTKINLDNFTPEILRSEKPVLLDFYAEWCGPCMMMAPELEAFSEENETVKCCKLNVDEETDLAVTFGVMSIPTVIIFKNGEIVDKAVGVRTKEEYQNMIKNVL